MGKFIGTLENQRKRFLFNSKFSKKLKIIYFEVAGIFDYCTL